MAICPCIMVSAQEEPLINDDFEVKLGAIKNPFESQLPQVEEEEEEEEKPDNIKPDSRSTKPDNQPDSRPVKQLPGNKTETNGKPQPPEPVQPPPEIVPLPKLTVTGVIWNSDRPQAIINGHVVNIGDTILKIKITDIQKAGIEGEFHGRSISIKTQRSQL